MRQRRARLQHTSNSRQQNSARLPRYIAASILFPFSHVPQFATEFSDQDRKQVEQLFSLCDTNGDGQLSFQELLNVIRDMGVVGSRAEVESLFQQLDTNGDGAITYVLHHSSRVYQPTPALPALKSLFAACVYLIKLYQCL